MYHTICKIPYRNKQWLRHSMNFWKLDHRTQPVSRGLRHYMDHRKTGPTHSVWRRFRNSVTFKKENDTEVPKLHDNSVFLKLFSVALVVLIRVSFLWFMLKSIFQYKYQFRDVEYLFIQVQCVTTRMSISQGSPYFIAFIMGYIIDRLSQTSFTFA